MRIATGLLVSAAQNTVRNNRYWRGVLQDVVQEYDYRPLHVEGQLPEALNDTYYQNGPTNFSSHGKILAHIFTGDGLIRSGRFQQGKSYGTSGDESLVVVEWPVH